MYLQSGKRKELLRHHDPDAVALIARMSERPQGNRQWLISRLIRDLKTAGIWEKLDVLWVLAAHDSQAARLNWKGNSTYDLTAVNSPTFTANHGFTSNGTTSYLNSNWAPSVGPSLALNAASLLLWNLTSRAASGEVNIGCSDGAGDQFLLHPFRNNGADNSISRINKTGSGGANIANTISDALFISERTTSTNTTIDRDGVNLGTAADVSTAVPAIAVYVGCLNNNGTADKFITDKIALVGAGGALGATKRAAAYAILRDYMLAVGAPI